MHRHPKSGLLRLSTGNPAFPSSAQRYLSKGGNSKTNQSAVSKLRKAQIRGSFVQGRFLPGEIIQIGLMVNILGVKLVHVFRGE